MIENSHLEKINFKYIDYYLLGMQKYFSIMDKHFNFTLVVICIYFFLLFKNFSKLFKIQYSSRIILDDVKYGITLMEKSKHT
jgi:hypothetical protein